MREREGGGGGGRERERERVPHGHTIRRTCKQKQTGGQMIQVERDKDRYTDTGKHTDTNRQTLRTDRQADKG